MPPRQEFHPPPVSSDKGLLFYEADGCVSSPSSASTSTLGVNIRAEGEAHLSGGSAAAGTLIVITTCTYHGGS